VLHACAETTSACTGLVSTTVPLSDTVMTPPATATVRLLPQAPTLLAVAVNFVAVAGTAADAFVAAGPANRLMNSRAPPSAKNASTASYRTL
jgi:hypothetical protein